LIALAALVVTGAALTILTPRVVNLLPAPDSSEIAGRTPIQITFSQSMDPSTFADRLHLSPEVEGRTNWNGRTLLFEPSSAWPEGARVVVELIPGGRSRLGLPLLQGSVWSFEVAPARMIFLLQTGAETRLVSQVLGEPKAPEALEETASTIGFSMAADGSLATLSKGANGVQVIRLWPTLQEESAQALYTCPDGSRCQEVAISSEAQFVAWTQQDLERSETGVIDAGPRTVWVMGRQAELPVQVGPQFQELRSPTWLSDGRLAAYVEENSQLTIFERAENGEWIEAVRLEHKLGSQWSWSPDARFVVFPEVELLSGAEARGGVEYYSHLLRVEVESGLRTDLSPVGGDLVEDASPVYSPDGLMLAFSRRWLDASRWTLGRQLWIMRADGSEAAALTDASSFAHSNFVWSPEGDAVAFVRVDQMRAQAPPEIWIYDLESGKAEPVVEGGYSPAWFPTSQ
jgi:hypothetical protein